MTDSPQLTTASAAGDTEIRNWRLIRRIPVRTRIPLAGPLQWLARLVSDLKYRFRAVLTMPRLEDARFQELKRAEQDRLRLAHEYSQGYITGWRECFDACIEAVQDEFGSTDEVWRLGAALTDPGKSRQDN